MASLKDQVIGHSAHLRGLTESLIRGHFSHAWIFAGPGGIGKRKVALALTQALVCEKRPSTSADACGNCGPCLRMIQGTSESVLTLAPTENQIRLEEARRVLEFLSLKGLGRARVVIIDGADLLNPQAANSLLKTLEEPPLDTYFFLIAGSAQDVLLTIRSRAQLVRFAALTDKELQQIVPAESWIIASSHGRVELARALLEKDKSELRLEALGLLESLSRDSMWTFAQRAKAIAPDRETTIEVLLVWQQLLRDFLFSKIERSRLIHQDLVGETTSSSFWREWSLALIQRLFELSLRAEKDVRANVDKGLTLERIWIEMHHHRNHSQDHHREGQPAL